MSIKNIIISLFLVLSAALSVDAQNTRANGRQLFNDGKFEEAKPIFKYLLKRNPKSAEYNYWYAVCCYETNDTLPEMEEMLKFAVSRRVLNASFYLAKFYKDECRYIESVECYEEYIKIGKDDDRLEMAEEELAHVRELLRMIKSTERVTVIDSIVVDKDKFLSAYRVGRDIGKIYDNNDYFRSRNVPNGIVFVTERENDCFYPGYVTKDSVEFIKLFHASKNGGEWSKSFPLKGFDTEGNDNYPFMSADGSTFYFASDGEGSIGGYDIFVTRYDTETKRFLRPTNMGMPFNSEANDYMLVVNEIINIGWFATDRRMPEGKVCIYVFIPNSVRVTYNYESLGYEKMLAYSQISSIDETQHDADAVRKAQQQLTMLRYEQSAEKDSEDFVFVVNDMKVYTSVSNFKSSAAKQLFIEWQKRVNKLAENQKQLEEKRLQYAESSTVGKQRLESYILGQERINEDEELKLRELEKEIRKLEHEYINK